MTKVITYGTYDLLHYGHIRLLERAKALGDYLIVGVTAEDFDMSRGKINVEQSLMERVEAVRATGIADEIIIEEYEGQKIDDIRRYGIDIFTVGSDWKGRFDYLNEYCKVVYLDRTEGVSSTELRDKKSKLKLGLVGTGSFMNKFATECKKVSNIEIAGVYIESDSVGGDDDLDDYRKFLQDLNAVYIRTAPEKHYQQIKVALEQGVNVLCESPITLSEQQTRELLVYAGQKNLILMEAIKTAYATAFSRLMVLLKSGVIGDIVSIDTTCTSIRKNIDSKYDKWRGIYEWAPTALLPVFLLLGNDYMNVNFYVKYRNYELDDDSFVKIDMCFENSVASIKVGDGVKAEGEMIIAGTKGYAYVPAPWWKTDYFEIRHENPADNKRYFYQLDGEGIQYEIVAFSHSISISQNNTYIPDDVTTAISRVMQQYGKKENFTILGNNKEIEC